MIESYQILELKQEQSIKKKSGQQKTLDIILKNTGNDKATLRWLSNFNPYRCAAISIKENN